MPFSNLLGEINNMKKIFFPAVSKPRLTLLTSLFYSKLEGMG
jgi:hypothetical protein